MKKSKSRRRSTRRLRFTTKKYLLLLSCMLLIFSPFSSLAELAYAEGDQQEWQTDFEAEPASERDDSDVELEVSSEESESLEEKEGEESEEASDATETDSDGNQEEAVAAERSAHDTNQSEAKKEERMSNTEEKSDKQVKESISSNDTDMNILASQDDDYDWIDNGDGTITITDYNGTATNVAIPNKISGKTVTAIGERAFFQKNLEHVTIPDTVETIGENAFSFNALEEITLPDSLKTIGQLAFFQNNLEDVTLPESLTEISNHVFEYNALKEITIPESVTTIGTEAFAYNSLEELIIPESVTSIGPYVFAYNELVSVTLPNSLTRIPYGTFSDNNLVNVTIPDSVTEIGPSAFFGNNLVNVTLPDGVTEIGHSAFKNNDFEEITLPGSVTEIGIDAFRNNELKDIMLPSSVTKIEEGTFANNNLVNVTLPDGVTTIGREAFTNNNLVNLLIPYSVTKINFRAFYANNLEMVTVTNSETTFENQVFALNQTNPEDLTIEGHDPSKAKTYAEENNHTFKAYEFKWSDNGDGTITITGYNGTATNVSIPNNISGKTVAIIGDSAFEGLNLESIVLPNSVSTIGEQAFANNNLTTIDIPESVQTIKARAFQNNNLETVGFSDGLRSIGVRAFEANQLEQVSIPESVTSISTWTFNDNNIKKATFHNNETSIGLNAFANNQTNSKDLVIEGFVNSTAETHAKNNNFTFIPFPVVIVDEEASIPVQLGQLIEVKDGNGVLFATLQIPNTVEPANALDGATLKVKTVDPIVATGLNEAGAVLDFTFQNASGDEIEVSGDFELSLLVYDATKDIAIYHQKDEDDWEKNVGTVAGNFITATVNDFSAYGVFYEIEYEWDVNDDGATVTITNYKGTDKDITIPQTLDGKTVTAIGDDVFLNKGLNSVVIPSTVTTIGYRAFMNNNLENITIPEGVKTLSSFVFVNNGLKSVTIPASLTSVERNPFAKNPEIKITVNGNTFESGENGNYLRHGDTLISGNNSGEIPNNVTEIGSSAFLEVDLVVITIPDSVEIIGDEAFSSNNITNVSIPDSVTTIQRSAFTYNDLTTIVIPESVENIGYNAFGHNNLTQVTIHNSQTLLASNVFFGNQTNPADLTIEGYANSTAETVANDKGFTFVPFSDVVVDGSALPVKPGMTVTVKDASDDEIAKLEIPNTVEPNDALDNATLEVRTVDPVSATGLAEAGAVLDFTFRNASGDEIDVSGDFELSLLVDDATKDIAIYHQKGEDDWEKIGGTVAGSFITATVNDFSAYGVFYEVVLEIASIETLANISVDYGTELNNLPLPTDVEVTLDDSTTRSITVSWDNGNPAYDGTQSGSYVFTGSLDLPADVVNPGNLEASVTVIVGSATITDVEILPIIRVDYGTAVDAIGLAEEVEVTLNDGSKRNISVTWDNGSPTYDGTQSGSYVFTGTLDLPADVTNPNNLEASVTVIVGSATITDVEILPIIRVDYGTAVDAIGLAEEVEVTLNDGSKRNISVTWDNGSPTYDGTQSGSYVFTGTLDLPADVVNSSNLEAKVTVEVKDEPKPIVDKDELKALIDEAESYDKDDYTVASFSVLESALLEAQTVYADDDATQAEVDTAADQLQQAIAGLEVRVPDPDPIVDKDELKALIDEAESYDKDDYTVASFSVLENALSEAQTVYADDDATQAEVDTATDQLQQAIDGLEDQTPDPDPTDLPPAELIIDFDETVEVEAGQLVKIKDRAISITLPDNLPKGTIITIYEEQDEQAAGDVIKVHLQLPDGEEGFTGDYQLTLGVEEELIDEEIAIFYYNEESAEWENQGGKVDHDARTITTIVDHFSKYGVLLIEEDKKPGDPEPKDPKTPEDPETPEPKDPKDPEDPKDSDDPEITEEEDAVKGTEEDSSKLPKTATSYYTLSLVGLLLMVVGGVAIVMLRRNYRRR